jgi:hypothetical protein
MNTNERSESCLSAAKTTSKEERTSKASSYFERSEKEQVREYLLREFARDMFSECGNAGEELERSESESYFEQSEKEPAETAKEPCTVRDFLRPECICTECYLG